MTIQIRTTDVENSLKNTKKRKRKCKLGESKMSDETSNIGLQNAVNVDSTTTVVKKKKRKANEKNS